jgi:DNA-binding transcriptional MerR regulator
MTGDTFGIGELARATRTKVETIRWYERIGLLAAPARTGGNYRAYGPAHLAEVERKVADLTALGRELRQIIGQCGHGTVAECRIIEALSPA